MGPRGVIAATFVAGTISVAFAAGVGITTLASTPYAVHAAPITAVPESSMDELLDRVNDTNGPLVDRYGNEVERAVGEYRIDYRGEVYERHSPQTALPKLGKTTI